MSRWLKALGAATVLIGVGAAVAYFAFIKAPGDVSNPDVEFTAPAQEEKPPEPVRRDTGIDWPLYGFDKQRSRYLPGIKLRPPFVRVWKRPGSHLIEFQPVLRSGVLYYLKNNGELYSVDAETGRVRWRRRIGGLAASSPAVVGGKVYAVANEGGEGGVAGSGRGKLVALDARSGRVRWAKRLSSASESSPLATEGRIYIGSQDGTVYCFGAEKGRLEWRHRAGGAVKAALAYSQGKVIFGAYGGSVTALRARNGRVAWRAGTSGRSFGRAGNFYATPAIAFGRVYIGNTDGKVYSFSARTGRLAWSHSTGGYVYAAAAVADVPGMRPAVFVGSYSGRFMALDARTGSVIWSIRAGGNVSGAASVIGRVVYFSTLSGRRTYAVSARTGKRLQTLGRGAFNPVISDGKRIYLTTYSSVYALTTREQRARERKAERRREAERERRKSGRRRRR